MHAQVGRPAHADADYRGRTGLPARVEHAVDHERLDRVHALGGNRHLEPGVVLGAAAFRDHLDRECLGRVGEIDVDDRHRATAGRVLVDARHGMHDGGTQRMLLRRALAALHDRLLQPPAVHFDPGPDLHVVDRNAGVLTQKIVRVLGDADVADHRAEYRLARRIRLAAVEPLETLLDVRRQELEGADIQLLRGFLDLCQIDLQLFLSYWLLAIGCWRRLAVGLQLRAYSL